MHFALREILERLFDLRVLAIWSIVTMFCIIAGPFGTDDILLPWRFPYWIIANGIAVILSTVIISSAYDAQFLGGMPRIGRGMIGAAVFSVLFAALMATMGKVAFPDGENFPGFALMLGYVGPIAIGITGIVHLFIARAPEPEAIGEQPPRILKRLKPGLNARLIRMSMQDHYVEVVTTAGSQLVLMRFSDALEEVNGEAGWRVHRSHWIAEAAITGLKRAEGKTLFETEDGAEIPISRTYMPTLREAGIIQRF